MGFSFDADFAVSGWRKIVSVLGWVVTIARAVKIEVMLIYFVRKRCVFNQAPSETQA
jgi:hypothetical protein